MKMIRLVGWYRPFSPIHAVVVGEPRFLADMERDVNVSVHSREGNAVEEPVRARRSRMPKGEKITVKAMNGPDISLVILLVGERPRK
jgi:hypothetical protein